MIAPSVPEGATLLGVMRPLVPLGGTLLAYEAGLRIQRWLGGAAWANPVLVAVVLIASVLFATGTSADDYQAGVQPLTFLLGPATVALALPLYRSLERIREALVPVLVGVVIGAAAASVSAVLVAAWLAGPELLLRSIATKSVTAAISMAVAQEIGGDPGLAMAMTLLTGIGGAVICTFVLDFAGVHDPRARGVATGVTAHGIGTARMLAISSEAGAFSGLAMGLTGIVVGLVVPLAASWLR